MRTASQIVDAVVAELDLGDDIDPTVDNLYSSFLSGWNDASTLRYVLESVVGEARRD